MEIILKIINENPESTSSFIKEKLGNDYSYGEIKAVIVWKETSKV
jgi:hypothetical protein